MGRTTDRTHEGGTTPGGKKVMVQFAEMMRAGQISARAAAAAIKEANVSPAAVTEFKDALEEITVERVARRPRGRPDGGVIARMPGSGKATTAAAPVGVAAPRDPWGDVPSEEEVAAAAERAERGRAAALAAELEDSLTREEAAERLGVTPQAVSDRRKAGRLVALRRGREWRFPRWQFSEDDALPGLRELAERYPGGALSLSVWAKRPHADLAGRAPAEELARRGGLQRVLELADAIRAAAW